MDAENRWWVAELLPRQTARKLGSNPGEKETMQKWYVWLEKMKKEDEEEKDGREGTTTNFSKYHFKILFANLKIHFFQ